MKANIVEKLIEEQEHVIEDLERAIKERQEAADIDEDDTRDVDDFAQQDTNKDFVRRLKEQLSKASADLNTLRTYKFKNNETFSPGALIETDNYYFLIGAAVHNINYNDKTVICISTNAPAYEINKDKKSGDQMKLGKQNTQILSVN